ncbi:MAG TPA: hypothetical protein VIM07_17755 [Chitinophagaceae bacterium]
MKKNGFLLYIFLIVFQTSYSQFILGKSFSDATKELKSVFLNDGLHFLNQRSAGEQPGGGVVYIMKFKEEFTVVIFVNNYENVNWVSFETKKLGVYLKLKSVYHSSKWKLVQYVDGNTREYSYKNFIIDEFPFQEYIGSNGEVYKFMMKIWPTSGLQAE